MKEHRFECELWLPLKPEKLFPFFSDAANLDAVTPPWLHFQIVSPQTIKIKTGTLIDYQLKVHGFPLRWRTLIRDWEPPHRFVDEQLRGPYRRWIHEHTFEPQNEGTLARDSVSYAVIFDPIAHPLFVRRDVKKIFAFRQQTLKEKFGGKK